MRATEVRFYDRNTMAPHAATTQRSPLGENTVHAVLPLFDVGVLRSEDLRKEQ